MNEQLINELCEKFHTTVDNLIPVYAKYMITKDSLDIIIGFILIIIGVLVLKHIYNGYKTEKYDEYAITPIVIAVCVGVFTFTGVIIIIYSVYDCILWHSYPGLRFLDTVLQIGG